MNIEQQLRAHRRQRSRSATWLHGVMSLTTLAVVVAGPALGTPGKAAVADPIGDTFGTGAARIDVTVKRYTNPLGTPSPAVTDTGAFASCP